MGESTAELTSDIEETRNRLGSHLDELQDKVSPSAIADRKKEAARSRILGVREKAFGTARSAVDSTPSPSDAAGNAAGAARDQVQGAPLAAGVAAFGLGLVIAAMVPSSRAEQKAAVQLKDTVQEQAQPLVDDAKQAAAEVGASLKDSAAESVEQVRQTGTEAVSTVADETRSSADTIRSETT